MKCKLLRLLVIVLLIMPVTTHALPTMPTTSSRVFVVALHGVRLALVVSGGALAYMTGMNLPQVASDFDFDFKDCSSETPENCRLKQYWEGGNPKGFLAMWGTMAPSVDAPVWIANSIYMMAFGLRSIFQLTKLDAPLWQKIVFLSLNAAGTGGALYGAYYYGEGDEQGAETVGKSIAKIEAFNNWCREYIEVCKDKASDVFHGKTNITWRNIDNEANVGRRYRLMNRIGGASVGYTLGWIIVDSMLFPVEHVLAARAGTLNKIVQKILPSTQLPQLDAMPESLLPAMQSVMGGGDSKVVTKLQKAWHYTKMGLGYGRGITALLTWFVIPNPFETFASPVFNPANYNEAAVASLNNTDIVLNEHGILHHRNDPHKKEYVGLDGASMAAEYLVTNQYVSEDDIKKITEAQHKVGAGIYARQYSMLTVALFSHGWSLPLNIRDFVTALSESKWIFAGDVFWNIVNIVAIWPYDVNLNGFVGTQHANGTQSIEALVAYLNGQNRTETELVDAQEGLVQGNMIVINGAWLGGISPRLTKLLKAFSPPVVLEVDRLGAPSPDAGNTGYGEQLPLRDVMAPLLEVEAQQVIATPVQTE